MRKHAAVMATVILSLLLLFLFGFGLGPVQGQSQSSQEPFRKKAGRNRADNTRWLRIGRNP